ncbi:isochorismatase family cysteine hydrolase [Bradyrhizobium sp. NBAIM01]|uniref:isochorismatase family cysteine hydrolase n=1 Tax=Bradyrhizobium sp. NBAIM01 TaxID=2793818 RepID=UPI001CD323A8|nr:isochorismatase family cysteine hydrolase [Bradyrhizobium sp. NBAIM01]MCA1515623.1 cysteine hydrolase [Bradyrhizobium sp. NBAIM01]
MQNVAVLTNDLQYDLVRKHEARERAVHEFLPCMVQFLRSVRSYGVHVFHLQLVCDPADPNVEWFGEFLPARKGTPGADILADVLDPSDIVVPKPRDSGFFETDLDDQLRRHGVGTLILTGMQAQICVQTTAADAFFRGYNVIVPPDGVVSTRQEDVERAIAWLGSYCATIQPMKDIIDQLNRGESFTRKVIKVA